MNANETLARKLVVEAKQTAYENNAVNECDAERQAAFFLDDVKALRGFCGFGFLESVDDHTLRAAACRAVAILEGK